MATTRLRKTFHYPSEDSDSSPELDEEHQERLIHSLAQQDAQKNALYRKAFLSIPTLAALFFLYTFVIAGTARQRLIALLSVSSLGCTGYILYFMPTEETDRKGKRPMYAGKSPVETYLPYLNAALAGLLLLAAALSWRKGLVEDAWREALPGVILGLSMFVRYQLAPLDLNELQKARYEYKGA